MRYVAFLRAINVGSHVIKMERLRDIFVGINLRGVETFIASGNVIFESPEKALALEKKLEAELQRALGYAVATFLRSEADLRTLASRTPFPTDEIDGGANVVYIAFLQRRPDVELTAKLMARRNDVDDFHVVGRAVYWLQRRARGDSQVSGAQLEKILRRAATIRNVTTVNRLVAKLDLTRA
ncbi:MAG: DUF1697 domain-containing protein [Verrucomicrobiota bacterium]|nr:DUF1697 domain-containing protein [Verrucomicrobiota bacterium]